MVGPRGTGMKVLLFLWVQHAAELMHCRVGLSGTVISIVDTEPLQRHGEAQKTEKQQGYADRVEPSKGVTPSEDNGRLGCPEPAVAVFV